MVFVQIVAIAQARTIYNVNLPNGLYKMKIFSIDYIDSLGANNHTGCTLQSDCFRLPFMHNPINSRAIAFFNKSDNGRGALNYTINGILECRNGQIDITLTGVADANFVTCIIYMDVEPTDNQDIFQC